MLRCLAALRRSGWALNLYHIVPWVFLSLFPFAEGVGEPRCGSRGFSSGHKQRQQYASGAVIRYNWKSSGDPLHSKPSGHPLQRRSSGCPLQRRSSGCPLQRNSSGHPLRTSYDEHMPSMNAMMITITMKWATKGTCEPMPSHFHSRMTTVNPSWLVYHAMLGDKPSAAHSAEPRIGIVRMSNIDTGEHATTMGAGSDFDTPNKLGTTIMFLID